MSTQFLSTKLAARGSKITIALMFAIMQIVPIGLSTQRVSADGSGSPESCMTEEKVDVENDAVATEDLVTYDAGESNIVTGVCIKSGNNMFDGTSHSGVLGNGTYENNCYVVSGVNTRTVTVERIGSGPNCQGISHIDIMVEPAASPSATVELKKDFVNDSESTVDLYIKNTRYVDDGGDGSTTGPQNVTPGESVSLKETPGLNLDSFTEFETTLRCTNQDNEVLLHKSADSFTGAQSRSGTISANKVHNGDVIACVFTNTAPEMQVMGNLIVKKELVNAPEGVTIENFSYSVNGEASVQFEADGSNTELVTAGTYTVVEVEANGDGYSTMYDNCDEVVVSSESPQTCTITNTFEDDEEDMPTLNMTKCVINDDGGDMDASEFDLYVDHTTLTDGSSVECGDYDGVTYDYHVENHQTYIIGEMKADGYELKSLTCYDGQLEVLNTTETSAHITITDSKNFNCVLFNDDVEQPEQPEQQPETPEQPEQPEENGDNNGIGGEGNVLGDNDNRTPLPTTPAVVTATSTPRALATTGIASWQYAITGGLLAAAAIGLTRKKVFEQVK